MSPFIRASKDAEKIKTYDTVEEMFFDIEREWKNKHPIAYWVDHTLFKGKGLCNYAPHHTLTHPWIVIKDAFYQVQQAYERVVKGWDYTAVWSIDTHLAELIPQLVRSLKENTVGISMDYFDVSPAELEKRENCEFTTEEMKEAEQKFHEVLDIIADGFDAYITIEREMLWNDPDDEKEAFRYQEMKSKFDKGMFYFCKYFHTLND